MYELRLYIDVFFQWLNKSQISHYLKNTNPCSVQITRVRTKSPSMFLGTFSIRHNSKFELLFSKTLSIKNK